MTTARSLEVAMVRKAVNALPWVRHESRFRRNSSRPDDWRDTITYTCTYRGWFLLTVTATGWVVAVCTDQGDGNVDVRALAKGSETGVFTNKQAAYLWCDAVLDPVALCS